MKIKRGLCQPTREVDDNQHGNIAIELLRGTRESHERGLVQTLQVQSLPGLVKRRGRAGGSEGAGRDRGVGGGAPPVPPLQLLHRNVQQFRGGLVFKAHRLCVSLNSRLESNKEEKEEEG